MTPHTLCYINGLAILHGFQDIGLHLKAIITKRYVLVIYHPPVTPILLKRIDRLFHAHSCNYVTHSSQPIVAINVLEMSEIPFLVAYLLRCFLRV